MKFIDDAKLKFGVWNRERKERAEAKKATRAMNSEHGHGRFFLLHVPAAATICAAIVEWYWALLFCIEATGHVDWNYETAFGNTGAASSIWNFAFSAHWPVLVGLVAATVPIVMLSMVWLPVQFAMRGSGRWRRGSVILCGILANILVIVSGTVVMNHNRQEQVREALVVEQTAVANRGAIQAQIDAVNGDLERLTDRRVNNEYAATAANVGAAAYRAQYMSPEALARSPEARRDIIVRALGAAERADALRAERTALFQQMAAAPTDAAVAANVEDNVGRELNTFAQYVEVWRPPFVAVICTLIGIFGAWWVIALMQGLNPRDVMRSGWADEGHRIEDLREEEPIVPQPMKPAREVVTDAETGEELVKVKPREYWRKRKGKVQKLDIQPEIPPDETGVAIDGGKRTAVTIGGAMEVESAGTSHDGGGDAASADQGDNSGDPDFGGREEEHAVKHEDGEEGPREDNYDAEPIDHPNLSQADEPAVDALEMELEADQIDETVPVDSTPAGGAAEESLPAEYEEAPDETAATASDTHHEPQERTEPETRNSHMLPNVAAE